MFYEIDKERATQVMKRRKVSQRKLAIITGISRVSIGKAVNGKPCRYNTLKAICQALDIYPKYLTGEWNTKARFTEFCAPNGKPIFFDAEINADAIPELNLDAIPELNMDAIPELNLDALDTKNDA